MGVSDIVNRHNVRIWGSENPHEYRERQRDSPKTCKEFCLFIDCVGPVVTQFGKRLITSANTNNDNLSLHIRQQNSQNVKARQVTKYWYEEIKSYNFFQDPSLLHTRAGHFTQMVWRSSTDFGVGKAKSRCGKVIVVANYKPAGNVIGEFQDNVFPPVNDMDILNEI
nr:basic form of pathogenesis-related protein 1 [Parasteatoda tepidariorum]